jgi:hypothetical protein
VIAGLVIINRETEHSRIIAVWNGIRDFMESAFSINYGAEFSYSTCEVI